MRANCRSYSSGLTYFWSQGEYFAKAWRFACVKKAPIWSERSCGAKRPGGILPALQLPGEKRYGLVTDPDFAHPPPLCFLRHPHSHVVHKCACSPCLPHSAVLPPLMEACQFFSIWQRQNTLWEVTSAVTFSAELGQTSFLKVASEMGFYSVKSLHWAGNKR